MMVTYPASSISIYVFASGSRSAQEGKLPCFPRLDGAHRAQRGRYAMRGEEGVLARFLWLENHPPLSRQGSEATSLRSEQTRYKRLDRRRKPRMPSNPAFPSFLSLPLLFPPLCHKSFMPTTRNGRSGNVVTPYHVYRYSVLGNCFGIEPSPD